MLTVRRSIPAEARRAAAKAIAGWQPRQSQAPVSGYVAIGDEIDPAPLLAALASRGHALGLPVMAGKTEPLTFRAYAPGDTLAQLRWGIREPLANSAMLEPDILLVPLLAVDRAGYRLGYGGGYYDRTLRRLRAVRQVLAVGLAYDEQIIDAVPHLDYDEPLDAVLSPSGCRVFPF